MSQAGKGIGSEQSYDFLYEAAVLVGPNEASKEGVNTVSRGTRAIAPRSWHSELVGIYPPRDELRPL